MEPKALNTLTVEAEKMRQDVLDSFSGKPPKAIEYIFGDMSFFFQEEVLAEWRRQERYDELIDYILYQYEERGGDDLWQKLLHDLRTKKDEKRACRLLDGLYPARAELFSVALKNYKKHPDNHFSAASYVIAKGEVMKVLYEHAFLLENKVKEEQNQALISEVRAKIDKILNK